MNTEEQNKQNINSLTPASQEFISNPIPHELWVLFTQLVLADVRQKQDMFFSFY